MDLLVRMASGEKEKIIRGNNFSDRRCDRDVPVHGTGHRSGIYRSYDFFCE